MYNIGAKLVYPLHGAGVVEAIEEKEVLGTKRRYYVLYFPIDDMKAMIPIENSQEIGLREISDSITIKKALAILAEKSSLMSSNWNQRYRNNLEKIKRGDVLELAEVIRDLTDRDQSKGLSSGEKKMLDNARQILISELILAQEITEKAAREMLEQIFA
ncbi:MAG: CarD family transcriptional regulator [Clostridia bacterium]|nr:CarD family transcriptional regulator [Clostridia bacterium]